MRHASARIGWTCLGFLICSLADVVVAGAQVAPSGTNATIVDVQPVANTHGWHATPVSIVFRCGDVSGDQPCRPPVIIDRDGANQRLDLGNMAGHSGDLRAVVVNLDQTPPVVSLRAPQDGTRTTANRVEVSGTVADLTSGLRWAACNGVRATVVQSVVRCSVALTVGTNQVVLHAMDLAGNSASAGVRVIRDDLSAPISVVPSTFVMGKNWADDGLFQALTAAGNAAPDVRWSVDHPGVVTLEIADGWAHLTPHAPGTVTLRARSQGRTATATITVLDADSAPSGTTTWSVAPLPGQPVEKILNTPWTNELNVSTVLAGGMGSDRAVVRALSLTGLGPQEVWRGRVDGRPEAVDRRGGVLTRLGRDEAQALVRSDGVGGSPIWRFDSDGTLGSIDVDEDGRLYVVESDAGSGAGGWTRVAVLDGATGQDMIRQVLPGSRLVEIDCAGRPRTHDEPADVGALIGLQHGVAATVVVQRVTHTAGCSAGRPVPGLGRLDVTHRLVLMRITTEGVEPVSTVWEWHDQGPDTAAWLDTVQSAVPGPLVPSADHGMLVFWGLATGAQPAVMHVTSVTSASHRDVVPVQQGGPWQTMLLDVFEANTVTLSNGHAVHALDLETGRTRRVAATAARLVLALADDRHIVVNDEAQGTLAELDADGAVAATWALGLRAATVINRDSDVIHGLAVTNGAFVECAIELPLLGGAYAVLDIDALAVPSAAHAALARLVR